VLLQFHEPHRLVDQLTGMATGFFVPAFFVLLGATLDFKSLVRSKNLMPEDALARINEWAEESLGDMLIEEGEPLRINRNLLQSQT